MSQTPPERHGRIFVGREQELSQLREAYNAAASGVGQLVMLAGEPGIGKTALCGQIVEYARLAGGVALSGHCYQERFLPYGAFSEALRDHVQTTELDAIREQLAEGAAEVALIVPEIRDRLDLKLQARSQAADDRWPLFEAVNHFLRNMSENEPLLLVLEDLHWADSGTLDLLTHISRGLGSARLLIVCSYREIEVDRSHPLSAALDELRRAADFQRISLKGLGLLEVRQMFEASRGEAVPQPEANLLHEQTEGNPLYVQEVLHYLVENGLTIDVGGSYVFRGKVVARVPEGLRDVLGRRLDHLSKRTNQVLSIAAVIGREFRLNVIQQVAALPEEELLEALEEATARSILEQHESPGGVAFRFSHALFRTVLYEEMFAPRRTQFHQVVGQVLEATFPNELQLHASELAEHFSHSSGQTDLNKALKYSEMAAEHAMNVVAYGDAVRSLDLALAIQEVVDRGDNSLHRDLLLRRAKAYASLGRWSDARVDFEAGLEELEGEARAEALLNLTSVCYWLNDMASLRRYAEEASEQGQSAGRDDLVAAAAAFVAQAEAYDGQLKTSLHLYREAIPQVDLRSRIHRQAFDRFPIALYWSGQYEEAAVQARVAIDAARFANDIPSVVTVLPQLGLSLAARGLYADAADLFDQARELGQEYGTTSLTARAVGMSVGHHIDVYDFGSAEELAQEANDLARSTGFLQAEISVGIDLLRIYLNRGDVGNAESQMKVLEEAVGNATGSHRVLWTLRLAHARAELQLTKRDWQGVVDLANDGLEQSKTLGRRKYESRVLTTRGRALVAMGKAKNGLEDLRHSVVLARELGDPALLLSAVRSLLSVEADDDSLITEATEIAGRISAALPNEQMRAQFGRAESLGLLALTADARAGLRYPDGLTGREVEVLRLIAGGSSNREVAEKLVLSLRTVERHITNIYAKIGARGRADATSYALRNSLSE